MGEVTMAIARQIRAQREKLGLSKRSLAERVGVAPSTVSGWESGEYAPSADTLVKLSELFGITLDEIYGIDEKKLAATKSDELDAEVFDLFKQISPDKYEQAKSFLRFLSGQAENKAR